MNASTRHCSSRCGRHARCWRPGSATTTTFGRTPRTVVRRPLRSGCRRARLHQARCAPAAPVACGQARPRLRATALTQMAGAEKRRSTEPRNTVTMGVAATQDSTSDWRELGAQVRMSTVLAAHGYQVVSTDIADCGFGTPGVDF